MGGPGLGRDVAVSRVGPFVVHGCNEDVGGWERNDPGVVSVEALVENGNQGGKSRNHFLGAIGGGPKRACDPSGCVGMNFSNEANMS